MFKKIEAETTAKQNNTAPVSAGKFAGLDKLLQKTTKTRRDEGKASAPFFKWADFAGDFCVIFALDGEVVEAHSGRYTFYNYTTSKAMRVNYKTSTIESTLNACHLNVNKSLNDPAKQFLADEIEAAQASGAEVGIVYDYVRVQGKNKTTFNSYSFGVIEKGSPEYNLFNGK